MNNIFDASSVTGAESNMDKEGLISEIVPKLKNILRSEFSGIPAKQNIKIYKDRLSFAAPCCGDSVSNYSKKRGNILLEGRFKNLYKCHNCGCCMSLNKFLNTFGESLSLDAVDYVSKNNSYISSEASSSACLNFMYDMDMIEELAVERELLKNILGLEECSYNNYGNQYLSSRLQYKFDYFMYSPKRNSLFVLNMTPNGKILGLQIRNLNPAYDGPKYKTYNLSKIYSMFLNNNDKEIPDSVNDMSMIFNILRVNYEKPVTITEGPMDAFLITNAIALCGAGKQASFVFDHRYMFDSDKTGIQHAMEYIKKGHSVFLWDKFIKDLSLPHRVKWDMNDVVIWAYKNRVRLPKLDPYYSSDKFDIMLL